MFDHLFEIAQDNPEFLQKLEHEKEIFLLHSTIKNASLDEAKKAILKLKDINEPSFFAGEGLLVGSGRSQDAFERIKLLVENGYNVNSTSFASFGLYELAMGASDQRIFEYLKSKKTLKFEELKSEISKLYTLATENKNRAFDSIIKHKFNNQITPIVATSLADKAIRENNPLPIKFLHDRKVTYHHTIALKKNLTILHFAAIHHADKVVFQLLQQGFNPNTLNYKKETPLIQASIFPDTEHTIKTLLDFGADINAQSSIQRSAAHMAVLYNQEKNLQLLIDKGIDLSIKDMYGKTALSIAKDEKNTTLITMIERAMENTPSLVYKAKPIATKESTRQNEG